VRLSLAVVRDYPKREYVKKNNKLRSTGNQSEESYISRQCPASVQPARHDRLSRNRNIPFFRSCAYLLVDRVCHLRSFNGSAV
jgi:hypothetical protein